MFSARMKDLPLKQQALIVGGLTALACMAAAAIGGVAASFHNVDGVGMLAGGGVMLGVGIYIFAVSRAYNRFSQWVMGVVGAFLSGLGASTLVGGGALTLYGHPTFVGSLGIGLLVATVIFCGATLLLQRRVRKANVYGRTMTASRAMQMADDDHKATVYKLVAMTLGIAAVVMVVTGFFV